MSGENVIKSIVDKVQCDKACQFISLGTSKTLIPYYPQYTKNGELITKDPNTYSHCIECAICNRVWTITVKNDIVTGVKNGGTKTGYR